MKKISLRIWGEIIFIILILVCIILLIVDVITIADKKTECLKNPLIYGVREWQKANNNIKFKCTCSFAVDGTPIIKINNETMEVENEKNPLRLAEEINWSNVEIINN